MCNPPLCIQLVSRNLSVNLSGIPKGGRGAVEPFYGGIGEFISGSNQVLQSKVEGEARIEGANPLVIEDEVRTRKRYGDEPFPRNCLKNRTWNH